MNFNEQKNGFEQQKIKNHPSEESHPVTDPLGKTAEETGDQLITT